MSRVYAIKLYRIGKILHANIQNKTNNYYEFKTKYLVRKYLNLIERFVTFSMMYYTFYLFKTIL